MALSFNRHPLASLIRKFGINEQKNDADHPIYTHIAAGHELPAMQLFPVINTQKRDYEYR